VTGPPSSTWPSTRSVGRSGRPAPFAKSRPASLGCRISGLARPELLVEIEVTAVKGAGAGIEWIGPDAADPLDAS